MAPQLKKNQKQKMQKNKISVDLIADFLNSKASKKGLFVYGAKSLTNAEEGSISFFSNKKLLSELKTTKSGVVLLQDHYKGECPTSYIVVDDPYLSYAKVAEYFFRPKTNVFFVKNSADFGIEVKFNATKVQIHDNVSIGDFSTLGDEVVLMKNVSIGSNVVIGNNTIIHENVVVKDGVVIGNNCEIHPGSVLGSDGFGYAQDKNKSWNKIPQMGTLTIGNEVHIGANTTIDRGALDNTIINDGVIIDNQVQIGHNVVIGKNTAIAGCVGIAGSAHIGKNCKIGGAAMILGHLEIANDTIVSPGTMITKSILKEGSNLSSIFPYFEKKDWLKVIKFLKKSINKKG